MFDTDEYAWKDIKVFMAGRLVTGIRGIKYKVARTKTDIYASGDEPHTRTSGNKTYTGEIKLLQSEAEALTEAVQQARGKNADITDMRFNATCAYAVDLDSRIKTDALLAIDVTEFEKGMEQNDPNMEITLPVMIGKIKYNI